MDKGKKDDWIRLPSKSRLGRFYLFNKATGETEWLPIIPGGAKERREEPPLKFSSINRISRTPAQDRLKRLQHSLKVNQTKPHISDIKLKHGELDEKPSTSSCSKDVATSHKKAMKISNSENDDIVKCAKSTVEENAKKLPLPDSTENNKNTTNGSSETDACKADSGTTKKLVTNENLQNTKMNNSKLTNIRSVIVKKIKEICKLPFNLNKKIADEKSCSKTNVESFGLINTSKFKTTSKTKSKQILSKSVAQEKIINQIKEEIKNSPENKTFICSVPKSTTKNQIISSYPKGSANSRLERLKQSLLLQQAACDTKNVCDTSIAIETNSNTTSLLERDHQLNSNVPTNTADKTRKDGVEAMDWQPILKQESECDATTFSTTLVVEKSTKCPLKAFNDDDKNLTMRDIIDTVNENLLRFSAEKQKDPVDSNIKWRKDFYYFVVDTNVLLQDLTFVEDLSNMKLCDTKGSVMYIPYAVLQELDKLKMRCGVQEGVKTLAVRAIKYLNAKLEKHSLHLQAQSAVEERHRLIEVKSADDSIINCCIQAKQHIPNLLFLTEDINLRNKAICNNITVSTKSDLVAKRYDASDVS